jgi:outer membrane lipoprotein-sorting protein
MALVAAALGAAADGPVTESPPRSPAPAPQVATDPGFEARLEAIDARIGQITQLRAEFEQRKRTPLLKRPIESSGKVLVKGDRLRWDTLSPAPSTLVTDASEIRIYYPDARVVEVYAVTGGAGDLRLISGTPLPRLATLKAQFALRELDPVEVGGVADPAEPGRWLALELTPNTPELRPHVESVRVLLDTTLPCVRRIVLTDPDRETTEIEFKNVQVSIEIRDEELKLVVPEGTRVSRPGSAAATATEPGAERPPAEPAAPAKPADAK